MKLSANRLLALSLFVVLAFPLATLATEPTVDLTHSTVFETQPEEAKILENSSDDFLLGNADTKPAFLVDPIAQLNDNLNAQLAETTQARCIREGFSCLFIGTKGCCPGLGCYLNLAGTNAYCL